MDALRHCLDLIDGQTRDGAKAFALSETRRCISEDLFIPQKDRGGVLKQLTFAPEKMTAGSTVQSTLQSIADELKRAYPTWVQGYLDALKDDIPVEVSTISGERLAWQIASFLRSEGLSDSWIANFCTFHIRRDPRSLTLADIIRLAATVPKSDPKWTFFVPLKTRRSFNVRATPMLQQQEFEERFKESLPTAGTPQNRGGLEITVSAADKYAAAREAELVLRRVRDRHRVSHSRRRFSYADEAWVSPGSWSVPVTLEPELRVQVRELDTNGGSEMFATLSEELEAALDLLIAADGSSARAATIAAWASIETLLADESDFGDLASIAYRVADILVCVYVRDTFEALAIKHSRDGKDDLAEDLRAASVAQRAVLVEDALPAHTMSVGSGQGHLARERALGLTHAGIRSTRDQIAAVLRRLYDIRNQIVHGGRMAPFGLERTYEESIVLLSALLDELIRQSREHGRSARQVAGRAAWLLGRCKTGRATAASLAELGQA